MEEEASISTIQEESMCNNSQVIMEPESEERLAPLIEIDEFEKVVESPSVPNAILEPKREKTMTEEFNLFENMDNSDTYVTYYVYVVKEDDTLEKVLTKYQVTKEEVALYNNIEEVKPGTKLIIPSGFNE